MGNEGIGEFGVLGGLDEYLEVSVMDKLGFRKWRSIAEWNNTSVEQTNGVVSNGGD